MTCPGLSSGPRVSISSATDAARILKGSKWDLNVAVDAFFQDYTAQENASARGGEGAKKEARDQKLKAIFKQYEGEHPSRLSSVYVWPRRRVNGSGQEA